MKIKYLKITLIALVTLCPLLSWAQQAFKPVLTTGKVWEVGTFNHYDWHDGRKVDQPTQPGIYISQGKKVVVK